MASGVVGSLLVKLGAVTAEFDRAMDKSAGKVKQVENTVGKTAMGTALGIGLAKGIGMLANQAQNAVGYLIGLAQEMDSVVESSQKIGIDTRSFMILDVVAKESATSIETVGKAIQTMKTKIAEGKGFESLGFSQDELKRMGSGKAFEELAKKIAQIQDPMERMRVETEMFGKAGKELDGVIQNLSGGMDAWGNSIPDAESVERLAALGDAYEKMMRQVKKSGIEVFGTLAQEYNEYLAALENSSGPLETYWRLLTGDNRGGEEILKRQKRLKEIQEKVGKAGGVDPVDIERRAEIMKDMGKLQEKLDETGKTDAEKRRLDFMRDNAGATEAEITAYDALNDRLEAAAAYVKDREQSEKAAADAATKAAREQEAIIQKGMDLVKSADPIKQFSDKVKELRAALSAGKITDGEFKTTIAVERKDTLEALTKDFKQADLVPALIMGTKEAYMAIAKAQNNPQLNEAKRQTTELKEIKKKLDFAETSL